jgi:hypothetical protein
VIRLLTTSDSRAAELVKALIDTGKLPHFAQAVEDGWPAWEAICQFESDLLAFNRKNRWCGCVDGWSICVGRSDTAEAVPEYVGWGEVQAWLRHGDVMVVIEPERVLFLDDFDGSETAYSPLADWSGLRLNLLLKQ